MNKYDNRQLGYSLAEVLVALAIFAVIFLAALTAYDRSNRVFKLGVESSNMQQNTRVAFDKVASDLRMAGYDFDRDGIPTGASGGPSGTNQYQQPDEQFEYIGPSAITVRANFDYETENQPCTAGLTDNCDNGREKSLESTYFPVVTTGNDELVTYALVPDSQTSIPACDPATNCVQFYADTSRPRKTYPDTGGVDEKVVQIPGVDLCTGGCTNPPYTLYRFTLDPTATDFSSGNNVIRTPLASNVRSLSFTYFQDAEGTVTLKDLNNTTDVSTGATIKGIGQFRVAAPSALIPEREIRAKVNSVKLLLIGMNENRDAAFTDTAEVAGLNGSTALVGAPNYINQYRKYRLETLISPRNIQKRGMREQDTFGPGQPTNVQICTGACGGVYITWSAPPTGATYGAPDQYKIIYDTVATSGYNCETTTFTNTFGPVFGTGSCAIQSGVPYKFAVVALNSYGSNSSAPVNATPVNATKYIPPVIASATTDQNSQVTLTWSRPNANQSGMYSCPPNDPNPAELQGYLVQRQDPVTGAWSYVGLPGGATTPDASHITVSSATDPVIWTDTTAVNCVNYNYRVRAVEACLWDTTGQANTGGDTTLGESDWSAAMAGNATTTIPPDQAQPVTIDQNSPCTAGVCNVSMTWPAVNTDTASPTKNPITIDQYIIERQLNGSGPWTQVATVSGGATSYIDPNVSIAGGEVYWYRVKAHSHCPYPGPGTDGLPSVPRPFPCVFGPGVVGSPLIGSAGAFDGDGSQANPFKISSGTAAQANINILQPAQIARVAGRDYSPGGTLLWGPTQLTTPPFTYSWTIAAGATEQFTVAVVDVNGCVDQGVAYFEDEAQNCCLTPVTSDNTVIGFSVPTLFVDFYLRSVCDQTLTLTGLTFSVDQSKVPNQNPKLVKVAFPSTSGGCADASYGTNCATYTFGSGVSLNGSGLLAITVPGSGGPGTFPSGVSTVPAGCSGCVGSVTIANGGGGYTSAPNVSFTGGGGTGATGQAVITSGRVTSVNITNGGKNYTSAPTVSFTGGGGSGATGTAVFVPPYKIRVYFSANKSITNSANQPVSGFTPHYTDTNSPTGTTCPIN